MRLIGRDFFTKAKDEFVRAQRFEHPFTVAMLDLDMFKSVNDKFGHMTGDMVLRKFVRTVYQSILHQMEDVLNKQGDKVVITASAGISSCKKADQSLANLIQRADLALYEAKHKGRNRIETI